MPGNHICWWHNFPHPETQPGWEGVENRKATPHTLTAAALDAWKPEAKGPQQPRRKRHGRWPDWESGEMVMLARARNKQQGPHTLPRLPWLLLAPRERAPCLAGQLPPLRALGSACQCPPA